MDFPRSFRSPFQPSSESTSSLPTVVADARLVQYAILAAFALQVYDYITHFDEEVVLVWSRRTSCTRKTLFFLNRYPPFITVFLATYFLIFNTDQSYCRPAHFAIALTALSGAVFAEWTLFCRTCAICSNKWCSRLLLLLAVIVPVGAVINTAYYVNHSTTLDIPIPHNGCMYWYRLKIEWMSVLALIFCESVAFCLLIATTIRLRKHSNSNIMMVICRDSIFYFICIIGSAVANLMIQLFASNLLCDVLLIPQVVLQQIFCTHFILRLRRLSEESSLTVSHAVLIDSPYKGPWCESDITV